MESFMDRIWDRWIVGIVNLVIRSLASGETHWCFNFCLLKQAVEQRFKLSVILDAMALWWFMDWCKHTWLRSGDPFLLLWLNFMMISHDPWHIKTLWGVIHVLEYIENWTKCTNKFPDGIFKYIPLNENYSILIQIWTRFLFQGTFDRQKSHLFG